MKYYVIRISKKSGEKHYMRTKCSEGWLSCKETCWQFSKQGAKGIVKRYSEYAHPSYAAYTYDIEPATVN